MISNRQMEYLLAIARTRNITKAAQLLHISQPSLSNQIISLEKQLGIPLLERRRKRVYLTDAGQYFATQSQKILTQSQNLEHAMNEFSQIKRGSLRLGLLPILCSLHLPEAIASFQKEYPRILLNLTVDGSRHLMEKLLDDSLDAIIAILEKTDLQDDITAIPLKTSPIYAAIHESHPLAAQQWGSFAYYGNSEGMAYTPPLTTTNILIGVAGDNAGMHPVGINNVNIFATGTTGVSYILICK